MKTSTPANAFRGGEELIGKSHKGKEIVSASRRFMETSDGERVERKGNRVEFDADKNEFPYRQIVKQ